MTGTKFLVDALPYYNYECIFAEHGYCFDAHSDHCPMSWDKYFVCSDENPHECTWMKELRITEVEE